jgi:hypothetical protein
MENAQRCRAMALLCRQQAVLYPDQKWKWLGQAERWEHLAELPHLRSLAVTLPRVDF